MNTIISTSLRRLPYHVCPSSRSITEPPASFNCATRWVGAVRRHSTIPHHHQDPIAISCSRYIPKRTAPNATWTGSQSRYASSASSTRWKTRQSRDPFAAKARTSALKSRAAFKLLELDQRHRLFKPGQTVIDLGFAPGAWSQVAVSRTSPGGRVVGVDVIPAQPPRGASSIQGNFLSAEVRQEVFDYVQDWEKGRARVRGTRGVVGEIAGSDGELGAEANADGAAGGTKNRAEQPEECVEEQDPRVVDVVLSDMSAPWQLTSGSWIKSVSNPYFRMINTTGIPFKDHAGSMDLCLSALTFCFDTLKPGGHFICKFFQGAEDKDFELRLKKLFEKVIREKPESSRKESKEAYFAALRRKDNIERSSIFPEDVEDDGP